MGRVKISGRMWDTALASCPAEAPSTPERCRLAVLVVDRGWPLRRAAERFQCSTATAKRWASRYWEGLALTDRPATRPSTSRVAYSEILDDERKETAAGFWNRANAFFAASRSRALR